MVRKVTFGSVAQNPGFRYLWANQVLVQLAYNTLNFALIVWVFKLVGTHMAVAALMLATYLPAVIFGIFAGVFVDVIDRRKLIMIIDFLLALFFLLFVFFKGSFLLILLNTFLINSLAQFFIPAEGSSIPRLVSRKQLMLANSLFSLTLYGAFMVGFSIGGPILDNFGINKVFYLGVVLLGFAFILVQGLPPIRPSYVKAGLRRGSHWQRFVLMIKLTKQEIRETFGFIIGKLNVGVAILLLSMIQGVIGVLAVIMPSFMERVLIIKATNASYFVILPLGFGMITGAFLIGRRFNSTPRRSIVIPAIIGSGLAFILVGIVPTFAHLLQTADLPSYITHPRFFFRAPSLSFFFAVIAYFLGFCMVSIIVPCQTVLQENTSEKNRGKIFAVLATLMTAVSAIAVVVVGSLSDLFGVIPIVLGLGVIALLIGLVARHPSLFLSQKHLSYPLKDFLGQGHWEKEQPSQQPAA